MKTIILSCFILMVGLPLWSQTADDLTALGKEILADEALTAAVEQVDMNRVEDGFRQLTFNFSRLFGPQAVPESDMRRIYFRTQLNRAVEALLSEFDRAGLSAEMGRIAPDFLARISYTDPDAFLDFEAALMEEYAISKEHLLAGMVALEEARNRMLQNPMTNWSLAFLYEPCFSDMGQSHNPNPPAGLDGIYPFRLCYTANENGYYAGSLVLTANFLRLTETKDPKIRALCFAGMYASMLDDWGGGEGQPSGM